MPDMPPVERMAKRYGDKIRLESADREEREDAVFKDVWTKMVILTIEFIDKSWQLIDPFSGYNMDIRQVVVAERLSEKAREFGYRASVTKHYPEVGTPGRVASIEWYLPAGFQEGEDPS